MQLQMQLQQQQQQQQQYLSLLQQQQQQNHTSAFVPQLPPTAQAGSSAAGAAPAARAPRVQLNLADANQKRLAAVFAYYGAGGSGGGGTSNAPSTNSSNAFGDYSQSISTLSSHIPLPLPSSAFKTQNWVHHILFLFLICGRFLFFPFFSQIKNYFDSADFLSCERRRGRANARTPVTRAVAPRRPQRVWWSRIHIRA
jgi:hypothetical protein